jgi:hypothetical protein
MKKGLKKKTYVRTVPVTNWDKIIRSINLGAAG